jgi:hypothetical protein
MMRRIYTMIVGPMISYVDFVWWQKSEQTTASAELQKLQRLACLLTTGAMKCAPKIALEAILDLPPLPAMVKKEAAQPNTENMQRHLKIYEYFQGTSMLSQINCQLVMTLKLEIKIYEREGWNHVPPEQSTLTYYTDGSRKDAMIGMGINGPFVRSYGPGRRPGSQAAL